MGAGSCSRLRAHGVPPPPEPERFEEGVASADKDAREVTAVLETSLRFVAALAFATACALVSGGGARAQALSQATIDSLAESVARYAQFGAARPLSPADRRSIVSAETAALERRPAGAQMDRRIAAYLASVADLHGPALESARTSAWNAILAASQHDGGAYGPITSTVLRYNPVVASDPRTGIAVSMHALQGYTSSVDLTARLGGRPALGNLDANRIAPALASTFSTYSPQAQRMVADGAERYLALRERVAGESPRSLAALRARLSAGTLTTSDVIRASQTLENSAMRDAFAAAISAFGSAGRVFAP